MRGGNLHIAIVDDDLSVRKGLRRLLESAGLKVADYASGEAFLDSLRYRVPDCLLLDLKMPGLSGTEVLQKIRRTNPSIPTIILSAHDDAETRDPRRCDRAVTVVAKPAAERTLLAAIDRVTSNGALAAASVRSSARP
jgi:FixJ family two-component response regulator